MLSILIGDVEQRMGMVLFCRMLDLTDDTVLLVPEEPTHFPTRGVADILDIALIKKVRDSVSLEVVMELSCDHHPVILLLGQHPEEAREETFSLTKTNWNQFHDVLLARSQQSTPRID